MSKNKTIYQPLQIRIEFTNNSEIIHPEFNRDKILERGKAFDDELQQRLKEISKSSGLKVRLMWKNSRFGSLINDCLLILEYADPTIKAIDLIWALRAVEEKIVATAKILYRDRLDSIDVTVAPPSWKRIEIETTPKDNYYPAVDEKFARLLLLEQIKTNWKKPLFYSLIFLALLYYFIKDSEEDKKNARELSQSIQEIKESIASQSKVHPTKIPPIAIPDSFTLTIDLNIEGQIDTNSNVQIEQKQIVEEKEIPEIYRGN